MAITQQQFDNNFVTRNNQISDARDYMARLCAKWDRLFNSANPANEGASSQLTLAGYVADFKTLFNTAVDELLAKVQAIEKIP